VDTLRKDRGIEAMDWQVTDDLEIYVRYQFLTDDGTAWSIPLRPAQVEANCDEHKQAAWEMARLEKLAQRLIRRGMPKSEVHELLDDLTGEIVGEMLDALDSV